MCARRLTSTHTQNPRRRKVCHARTSSHLSPQKYQNTRLLLLRRRQTPQDITSKKGKLLLLPRDVWMNWKNVTIWRKFFWNASYILRSGQLHEWSRIVLLADALMPHEELRCNPLTPPNRSSSILHLSSSWIFIQSMHIHDDAADISVAYSFLHIAFKRLSDYFFPSQSICLRFWYGNIMCRLSASV